MLFGAIRTSPVFGGTLKSVDETPAIAMPGVKRVVRQAMPWSWSPTTPGARSAIAALKPVGTTAPTRRTSSQSIAAHGRSTRQGRVRRGGLDGRRRRRACKAERRVEAIYRVPYLAHATMETDELHRRRSRPASSTVWGGFQHPLMARKCAADVAGLDPANVERRSHGDGRRLRTRAAASWTIWNEAVPSPWQAGAPVQLAWTREEDMTQDFYRECRRGADGGRARAGRAHRRLVAASPTATIHRKRRRSITRSHTERRATSRRTTRFPGRRGAASTHTQHGFFIESFVDELAHAAGRIRSSSGCAHLDRRAAPQGALERAAEMASWGTPPPAGRARGIAMREVVRHDRRAGRRGVPRRHGASGPPAVLGLRSRRGRQSGDLHGADSRRRRSTG